MQYVFHAMPLSWGGADNTCENDLLVEEDIELKFSKRSVLPHLHHLHHVRDQAATFNKHVEGFAPICHGSVEIVGKDSAGMGGTLDCTPGQCSPHVYWKSLALGQTMLDTPEVDAKVAHIKIQFDQTKYDVPQHNCC